MAAAVHARGTGRRHALAAILLALPILGAAHAVGEGGAGGEIPSGEKGAATGSADRVEPSDGDGGAVEVRTPGPILSGRIVGGRIAMDLRIWWRYPKWREVPGRRVVSGLSIRDAPAQGVRIDAWQPEDRDTLFINFAMPFDPTREEVVFEKDGEVVYRLALRNDRCPVIGVAMERTARNDAWNPPPEWRLYFGSIDILEPCMAAPARAEPLHPPDGGVSVSDGEREALLFEMVTPFSTTREEIQQWSGRVDDDLARSRYIRALLPWDREIDHLFVRLPDGREVTLDNLSACIREPYPPCVP